TCALPICKIAFYVEKPLNQILGAAASPGATEETAALPGALLEPEIPAPADLTRTGPISLSSPDLNRSNVLLGGQAEGGPAPIQNLFKPQPGRADFMLGGEAAEKKAATDDAPVTPDGSTNSP